MISKKKRQVKSITFNFTDKNQIGYHKIYGIPDGVICETTDSIPSSTNESPEYVYVSDDGFYRKCVIFDAKESSCEITVMINGIESSEWQIQENKVSSFLNFKKNVTNLVIYASKNITGYGRTRELVIKSTTDISSFSTILIVQNEEEYNIELEHIGDSCVIMNTLLDSQQYQPEVIDPIKIICTGGSEDFLIKDVTTRTYYGDNIEANIISDSEMESNIIMYGSGWKQGDPQYVIYNDRYFQHYIKENNDNTTDNNYSILNAEPCMANHNKVMRFTDNKFGNDIVIKKTKNNAGELFLNITNLGRLWNDHDNTIFKIYIITLCHRDNGNKTLKITAYYQN